MVNIEQLRREQEAERNPEKAERLKAAASLIGLSLDVDNGTHAYIADNYWTNGTMYRLEIAQVGASFEWRVVLLRYGKLMGSGTVTIGNLSDRADVRDSLLKACELAKESSALMFSGGAVPL